MLVDVLVDRVIDVGYEDYCANNCPFMRMSQDEHTLEWGYLCMLSRPIVPLKCVENLHLRTNYCMQAQKNLEALAREASGEE
jgi:hypothetical protein